MNYYEHHLGDYLRDTVHLSIIEDGAYRRLLEQYYIRERPLPRERAEIYKLVRASTAAERKAVDYVLGEFFSEEEDGYHQARADAEIRRYSERAERARRNGRNGGRPRNPEKTQSVISGLGLGNPEKSSPVSSPQSEDSRRGEDATADPPEPDPEKTLDQALYAEARRIFGESIGGQVNRAIKAKGKPWVVQLVESCRRMDQQQARAYFAAALRPAQRPRIVT